MGGSPTSGDKVEILLVRGGILHFLIKMLKLRSVLTLAGFGLTSGAALLASPAHAGSQAPLPTCPQFGTSLAALITAGCSVGDKNFYDFSYSGSTAASDVGVSIGGSETVHTLNLSNFGSPNRWTGTGVLTYTVAVNNRTSEKISGLAGGMTTSLTGSTYQGSINPAEAHSGVCLVSQIDASCVTNPIIYTPWVELSTITNEWDVSSTGATGITQMTNSIYQSPGPLSILGAGTAFGFSRRLRSRIKHSA